MKARTPAPSKLNLNTAPLIRAHVFDLLADVESLSISIREALRRGDDALALMHWDQSALIGREIARSFRELREGEGGN